MENTITNKSRFFALYWGQRVWRHNANGESNLLYINAPTICRLWSLGHLELKALSAITDEDAIEVAKMCEYKPTGKVTRTELYGSGIMVQVYLEEGGAFNEPTLNIYTETGYTYYDNNEPYDDSITQGAMVNAYDYLRSRGYALPYLDASVNDLIEMGWVQLAQQTT